MTYNDEAIIFPVAELYDLGVMNKYIDALHEQYLRGEKEYQDYISKYGDFTSASPYDVEKWNQLTMDPVEQKWNLYTEAGIDPLRNREAMFDIMSTARRAPRLLLAALRQNAEAYKAFNIAKLKLLQQGLYNPLLNGLEGDDPEAFRTIGENGQINMFDRQSPTPIQDMTEFSADYYKDLKPIVKKESRDGIEYSISQITPEMLMGVAMDNIQNIINTPQGRLMYRAYLQQTDGDELAAAQLLAERVAMSLKAKLYNSEEMNDNFFDFLNLLLNRDKYNLDERELDFEINKHAEDLEYKKEKDKITGTSSGYSLAKDVYTTSLAKAAGIEYLPQEGVTQDNLSSMLLQAVKYQNKSIIEKGSVLAGTGMRISPEKVAGLILSDGKNGRGYFLNPSYFLNLHDLQDIRTSYKGWAKSGATKEESKLTREKYKQQSKDIISAVRETLNTQKNKGEFRLKVVPTVDENGNNVYGMVGDDNRWHTYARVRVYLSDGKSSTIKGGVLRDYEMVDEMGRYIVNDDKKAKHPYKVKTRSDIPEEGVDMVLEIGLHSNEGKASPDLSVTAREELGPYAFLKTKSLVGLSNNGDWSWGTNIMSDTE